MADVTIEPGQVWSAPKDSPPLGYVVIETTSLARRGPAAAVWVTDVMRTGHDHYRRVGGRKMNPVEYFLQSYSLTPHRMPVDPPAHPRLKLVNVAHVTQLAAAHADVVNDIEIFKEPSMEARVHAVGTNVRVCRNLSRETLVAALLTALEGRRMEIEAELVRLGVDIE